MDASLIPPPQLIDGSVYGAWYSLQSIVIIVLLAIVCFYLRRTVSGIDKMNESIVDLRVSEAETVVKVDTHISNDAIHCPGTFCRAERRQPEA